jgi:hypothetical protein
MVEWGAKPLILIGFATPWSFARTFDLGYNYAYFSPQMIGLFRECSKAKSSVEGATVKTVIIKNMQLR